MTPLARKDKLTVREMSAETLVYDLERHAMHCLNRTAALVWKHCDGRHDAPALAALAAHKLNLPADEAEAAVRLALEQLSRRGLLQEAVATAAGEERLTRRKALRKMAVAAAAALPVIMTLKSPAVAWGATNGGCVPGACPDGFTCVPSGHNLSRHDCNRKPTTTTTTTTTTPPPSGSGCTQNSDCVGKITCPQGQVPICSVGECFCFTQPPPP
jgi:hypothetical protein